METRANFGIIETGIDIEAGESEELGLIVLAVDYAPDQDAWHE